MDSSPVRVRVTDRVSVRVRGRVGVRVRVRVGLLSIGIEDREAELILTKYLVGARSVLVLGLGLGLPNPNSNQEKRN